MSKIITIVGPTGVGKTKLSIELAKKLKAEIINSDAVQVYKYLNIGTAKVTKEEQENIKHHMIDFVNPLNNYTVADYQKDARRVIDDLIKKNKNVIIVGGTGLYLKALLYDYNFLKEEKASTDYSSLTNSELKLTADKIYSKNNIHINNRKRLIRFIDAYNKTGKIIKNENKDKLLYKTTIIGLTTNREKLYEIINKRVDTMFDKGLLNEAKELYNKNIDRCRNVIGYKELFDYFDNLTSLEEAKEKIKQNSRKYAKRQYTWFNNQMDVKWFNVDFDNFNETINKVEKYINKDKF